MDSLIRPASESDLPVLQGLADEIWHEHYPGIISAEQIRYMLDWMYSTARILDEMQSGIKWWLALKDNQPCGFFSTDFESASRILKLKKAYLLRSARGSGIFGDFISLAKQQAERLQAHSIELTVNKANSKSIAAYQRQGFVVVQEVTADIGNGFVMDDFVMRLTL